MKKKISKKFHFFPVVTVILIAITVIISVLVYQQYQNSRTVNGRMIDEKSYIGLSQPEAEKHASESGILTKISEVNGDTSIPNDARGSCNGYIWLSLKDDVVIKARFEPSKLDC